MPFFYLPVEKQLLILNKLISTARSSHSLRPNEKLIIQKRRTGLQYYARPEIRGAQRSYIRKENLSRACSLAQREYETVFLKAANEQKGRLLELISNGTARSASIMYHALAEPYESLPEERKVLVTPYVLPDEQYIRSFLETPYEKKGFAESAPMIFSEKGERVRSKSEKIIADKLARMDIPYLYEYPLFLHRIGRIHPDFTLLDIHERTTVILEHLGMMQDSSYLATALSKIEDYIFDGYFPGDRLLITYEGGSHVLNVDTLERLIRHRFSS